MGKGFVMTPIRVLIVEANDLVRFGILQIIHNTGSGRIRIVGAFADLTQVVDILQLEPVDILILDDTLPTVNRMSEYLVQIKQQFPKLAIVVTSNRLSGMYVQRLLEAGAVGFIYKSDRFQGFLVPALETIHSGSIYVSPKVNSVTYLMRSPSHARLRETDRDVLLMIARGYNTQEIASAAGISSRSVYRIRTKLRHILNVKTNEQIVDAARKQGLLDNADRY